MNGAFMLRWYSLFIFLKAVKKGGVAVFTDGLTLHAIGKLRAGHGLVLHEEINHLHELGFIPLQDLCAVVISFVDQLLYLIVHGSRHLLGVALGGLVISADEQLIAAGVGHST